MTASDPTEPSLPPLRNLEQAEASRPAGELLGTVPWLGEEPDPEVWRSEDFLALL
ncbi:MAG: hypothetical protein JNL21_28630 [Myxococcales bacterium]|nr:hypothetical protein [Myxococcales bacterium]